MTGGAVGGAKQKPPHVQTVQTKNGKQVDVNNNQNYVSAKIPQGAIPIQKQNNGNAGVPAPASPPAPSTKIQPSSNPWGLPSSVLPGSVAGKTAGLSSSKSAPVLSSNSVKSAPVPPKRSDPSTLSQKSGSGKTNANANLQQGKKLSKSSGARTRSNSQSGKPSLKTNPSSKPAKPLTPRAQLRQYLRTKAFLQQRQQVIKAYGLKPPRNKISEQKYLRAIQLQRKLYKRRQILNNPLHTPKTKQSNQDAVSGMPENPQHMESSAKALANWLDRHPRWDAFVGGLGNMASNAVAFSISGIVVVAYTKGVWGPKEQAIKKTLENSNKDQPYSLLTDPTTNLM